MKKSAEKARNKASTKSGAKGAKSLGAPENSGLADVNPDNGGEIAAPFRSALELVHDSESSKDEFEEFAAKFETAAQLLASADPSSGILLGAVPDDELSLRTFETSANENDEPLAAEAGEFQQADDGEGIEAAGDDEATPDVPLISSLSALLFVSTRPLTLNALCRASRASKEEVLEALDKLSAGFEEQQLGITLVEAAGAYQLRSAPKLAPIVKRLIRQRERRLSRAAAETLAVVAYKQPVGRAEIEAIRGVDALPTLKTLLEARLIRIVGRDSSVGHPALFGTTDKFLERFGLSDLSDLMSMKEVEQLMRDPGEAAAEEEGAASADFAGKPEVAEGPFESLEPGTEESAASAH